MKWFAPFLKKHRVLLLTLLLSVVARYLSGGTASGVKHVTDEHEPAMYHVKSNLI